MEDGYCVKWEKHPNAIVSVFDNLYKHNVLVDCTLAAENKFIKAHRIVLMACSPYFEDLLSQHSDNYPIVWLSMKFTELQALIDFCYRGEVRLPQAELPGFLNAARLLQIKGLCESSENYRKRRHTDGGGGSLSNSKKYRSGEGFVSHVSAEGECVGELIRGVADLSADEEDNTNHHNVQTNGDASVDAQGEKNSDRSDLDTDEESSAGEEKESIALDDFLNKSRNSSQMIYRWTCSKCGEAFTRRSHYQQHKKGCTADPSVDHPWKCHKCPNTYKNKKDLVRHLLYCGNETERHICERCGSTYKYERGLKRHKIYCGTDVKPMVCNACGKTYKYKRGLRRHQKQQCGLIESYMENRLGKAKSDAANENVAKSPIKVVTTPRPPSTPALRHSDMAAEEDIVDSPQSTIKDGNAPAVCQTCGKVYKYKKAYLNHVVNCVATEGQPENENENAEDEEDEDEEPKEKGNVTVVEVEVHGSQEESDQVTGEDQVIDDQCLNEENAMDDKAIEQEIDELDALKKELESEEMKADIKEESIVVEETRNNNTEVQTVIEEASAEETPKT